MERRETGGTERVWAVGVWKWLRIHQGAEADCTALLLDGGRSLPVARDTLGACVVFGKLDEHDLLARRWRRRVCCGRRRPRRWTSHTLAPRSPSTQTPERRAGAHLPVSAQAAGG